MVQCVTIRKHLINTLIQRGVQKVAGGCVHWSKATAYGSTCQPYRMNHSPAVVSVTILLTAMLYGSCSDCPFVWLPTATNRTSEDTTSGVAVLYQCTQRDYSFNDTNSTTLVATCSSEGEWQPFPVPCRRRTCGLPPRVPNSILSTSEVFAGTVLTYKCFYGFTFPGAFASKSITCDSATLQWTAKAGENISDIRCEQNYCPSSPPNLTTVYYEGLRDYINGTGLGVGSVVNGYCLEGYSRSNSRIVTTSKCSPAKVYDVSFEECKMNKCALYSVNNLTRSNNNTSVGSTVRYECKHGLLPGGTTKVRTLCDTNGQWMTQPALSGCQGGGCEDGWTLFNGSCYQASPSTSLGLRFFSAEQSCKDQKSHLATIESAAENDFVFGLTSKKYLRDYWIGYYMNQTQWTWIDGSKVSYLNFAVGYPEENKCTRMTQYNVWKDRDCSDLMAYICRKPAMCGAPPVIAHGRPVTDPPQRMSVGDTLVYECDAGYSWRSGGATVKRITCLEGGFYSSIDNCQETLCLPITRVGFHVRNAVPDSDGVAVGTIVKWTCKTGFIFPDGTFQKSMECLENRTWSGIPPMCLKALCPLPAVKNARARWELNGVGDADYYDCNEGFEYETGEKSQLVVCQTNGIWLPTLRCQRMRCSPYVQIHGNTSFDQSRQAFFEDTIDIVCDEGFQLAGGLVSNKSTCGPQGLWIPYFTPCEPMRCPGDAPPPVLFASTNTTNVTVGTVVIYTCNDGYTFIDGDFKRKAYCDFKTQQWIGVPTECFDSIPDQEKTIIGVRHQIQLTVAVLTIFGLVILPLVIACADCHEDRKGIIESQVCQGTCRSGESQDNSEEDD